MANGVADLDRNVQHLVERGRVHRENAGCSLERGRSLLDEAQRDGAHVAKALRKDEVGAELFEQLDVEGVDAVRVGEALPDGGIYLGAGQCMLVYYGTGELGEVLDAGRVVALVGHADQGVSGADEVDDLGGAREEGDDAQEASFRTAAYGGRVGGSPVRHRRW